MDGMGNDNLNASFIDDSELDLKEFDWGYFIPNTSRRVLVTEDYPIIKANKYSLVLNTYCKDLLGFADAKYKDVVDLYIGFSSGNNIIISANVNNVTSKQFKVTASDKLQANMGQLLASILLPNKIAVKYYPKWNKKYNALLFSPDSTKPQI